MEAVAAPPPHSRAGIATTWLSLVIPAFNESESIVRAIDEALAALQTLTSSFEILVVDDGSDDETAPRVVWAAQRDPRVRLVRHAHNRGYGAALRSGFLAARGERVAFTDADCQFHLRDLARLLSLAESHDVVCGYRLRRQDSPRRRFLSWGYNALVRVLLGAGVRDVDCALKVFRRDRLLRILPKSEGFFANTEMLVSARRLGMSVAEVGVMHRPRWAGESKVSLGDVPRTLATLLPYWWRMLWQPSPEAEQTALMPPISEGRRPRLGRAG